MTCPACLTVHDGNCPPPAPRDVCDCWCHDAARYEPIVAAVAAEMTREQPPWKPPVKPWRVKDWPRDPATGRRSIPPDVTDHGEAP